MLDAHRCVNHRQLLKRSRGEDHTPGIPQRRSSAHVDEVSTAHTRSEVYTIRNRTRNEAERCVASFVSQGTRFHLEVPRPGTHREHHPVMPAYRSGRPATPPSLSFFLALSSWHPCLELHPVPALHQVAENRVDHSLLFEHVGPAELL